jgi:hypothetical protein
MIKQYALDIAIILMITGLAFVLAGQPVLKPDGGKAATPLGKAPVGGTVAADKGINRSTADHDQQPIKGKNIFVPSGAYTEPIGQVLTENPYVLIAVLQGKEKKAVFREQTGNVVTLPVGKSLLDGFVITRIDSVSVQLQKRDQKKELRLFNAGGGVPPPTVDKSGVVPKTLYTLVGVLDGNEKKAVFRDYKGAVSILGIGAKLLDGRVITDIDALTVKLKKGNERSELRAFAVRTSEQPVGKQP